MSKVEKKKVKKGDRENSHGGALDPSRFHSSAQNTFRTIIETQFSTTLSAMEITQVNEWHIQPAIAGPSPAGLSGVWAGGSCRPAGSRTGPCAGRGGEMGWGHQTPRFSPRFLPVTLYHAPSQPPPPAARPRCSVFAPHSSPSTGPVVHGGMRTGGPVSRAVRERAGARPDNGRPSPSSHRMFVENLVLNDLQTT